MERAPPKFFNLLSKAEKHKINTQLLKTNIMNIPKKIFFCALLFAGKMNHTSTNFYLKKLP